MTSLAANSSPATPSIAAIRARRAWHRRWLTATLVFVVLILFVLTLVAGGTYVPPMDVVAVLLGEDVPGAGFVVGDLRLPRATLSLLAGLSFGLGGITFQTMLRNPLASPDIIGISSGASAAAVFAIVVLSLNGPAVSAVAVAAGLGVALLIYGLSLGEGLAGARLILVGIGIAAMLQSVTAYLLSIAPAWSLQEALRWLTGSINGAQMADAGPLLLSLGIFGGLLVILARDLDHLRLGDDAASGLGVRPGRVRLLATIAAVGLVSVATAATGPIAFVAFLSGPIAARIVRDGGALLLPASLVGAILVLAGDYAGQVLLPSRYPVGVITGALGAPFLIYLLTRIERVKGAQ